MMDFLKDLIDGPSGWFFGLAVGLGWMGLTAFLRRKKPLATVSVMCKHFVPPTQTFYADDKLRIWECDRCDMKVIVRKK